MNRIHIVIGLQITVDKREIKDFPKLPSATLAIRNTLCATGFSEHQNRGQLDDNEVE